ncbi:MAG: branched-chain amino acid ABC transporter permease [Actinomycetota bacterium]
MDTIIQRVRELSIAQQIGTLVGVAFMIFVLSTDLRQALVIGLINGAMYGLVALGLVLIYKSSGIFNFAQGEFGTVAIYVMWMLLERDVPYVFSVIIALVIAVAIGLGTERLIIRPLYSSPRVIVLVATAGVALLMIGLEFWIGGPLLRTVSPALMRTDRLSIFGVLVSDQRMLLVLVLLGFGIGLAYFFTRTSLGLALLGVAQEPTATELVGISTKQLAALIWGMAALLGGLAGILNAPISGTFGPGFMTLSVLIPAFTAAILGGMNSLPGAFLGGALVGVAESIALKSSAFASIPSPDTLVVFLILIVVLMARPQGLLGRAT